ncbi:MAG: hypothetical protein ACPGVB_15325 [Chitinophagales bacterium]
MKNNSLESSDPLTQIIRNAGIQTWTELCEFVQRLPYGRNSSRTDFSLVLTEKRGTCSSKHAFLKKVADFNNLTNIQLTIGLYRMSEQNTPNIGSVLQENGMAYIPEAHCYLHIEGKRVDLTNETSDIHKIEADILEEIDIQAEQVGEFKVVYHQSYLKKWLKENDLPFDFDQLWAIREQCIENLSRNR